LSSHSGDELTSKILFAPSYIARVTSGPLTD